MKKIIIAVILSCFASVARAQVYSYPADHTLEQLIDARAKLIQWYVLSSSSYAWGVSVCGEDDVLTGASHSWLTVYVYKDSLAAFAKDFDKAATRNPGGSLGVDGITVVVEVIERKRAKP